MDFFRQSIYLCEAILQVVRWPRGAGSCFQLLNAPWGSRCKAALKLKLNMILVEVASTRQSLGRLEKKCRLSSNLALGFSSLSVCPLDRLSLMLKWVAGSTFTKPFRILKTSSRSALSRRFSSDISPVRFRRSS